MDHKAYILDHEAFSSELSDILYRALETGETGGLVSFIQRNLGVLKEPYEGEPLDESWITMIESHDPHQYGDFALTKFYDPKNEMGLGDVGGAVIEVLRRELQCDHLPVLGSPFGPPGAEFDPGKLGSYFQDAKDVKENLQTLESLRSRLRHTRLFDGAIHLLETAQEQGRGLYVTF